ncbi:hypothetical protein QWY77_04300 [Thalassotalea ponticola]|uniref:hypothetical protein n=1 Tax=Thalassotalea ponticola TaxID=1523392 RepID=UPI0025B5A6DB|nr:hypothetical protein [Thalassotalea ponticola]MDN3651987.1 hypothetical protein [Thalassotalea ponticola]
MGNGIDYIRQNKWLLACALIGLLSFAVHAQQVVRDEEIIFDLLRSGELDLSKGVAKAFKKEESITKIRRVGLVKGQYRIRAALRDKSFVWQKEANVRYKDAYYHELAAYVIAKYLGLNIIPPTVIRRVFVSKKGLKRSDKALVGSLQFWIENAEVLYDIEQSGKSYPGPMANRNSQIKEIKVFDCIIGNVDRHAGNLLVDFNPRYDAGDDKRTPYIGKIWAIDHSRSFYYGPLRAGKHCRLSRLTAGAISRSFINGIRAWDIEELARRLRASGLTDKQLATINLNSLEQRFQAVKKHFLSEQKKSALTDADFYTDGIWHRVH